MEKAFKLFIFLSIFVFISCEKENLNTVKEDVKSKPDFEKLYETRVDIASKLSMLIEDEVILKTIESACLKSPMGDPEILFSDLMEVKLANQTTIGEAFEQLLSTRSKFDLKDAMHNDPLLDVVLMPGKGKTREQYVSVDNSKKVYIDKIFKEYRNGEKLKYTFNGIIITEEYSDLAEPLKPYFVLKQNEEYIAYYKKDESLFYQPEFILEKTGFSYAKNNIIKNMGTILIVNKSNLSSTERNKLNGNRTSCGLECERDYANGKDAIYQMKLGGLYEGWLNGGPEYTCQYALGLNNNLTINPTGFVLNASSKIWYPFNRTTNQFLTKTRDNVDLKTIQHLTWYRDTHTRDMMQHWSEDDGGFTTIELNPSLKAKVKIDGVEQEIGFSAKWTFTRGDDEIGSIIAQYCDPYSSTSSGYDYIVSGPDGIITTSQRGRGF